MDDLRVAVTRGAYGRGVKILHTSDWHVGRTIRGRSRADEHVAVLGEIAAVAAAEAVDIVVVVGDLFDTAAPAPESERIVFRALLDLATTGATVVVVAGNHDSGRRLQAVQPLLELGAVVTRPVFARPDEGGLVEITSRDGRERAQVALLPFLSQRYVVRAGELMGLDAQDHGQLYDQRVRDLLAALTAGFRADTVNLVAAHLSVTGGLMGGGERLAHTLEQYQVGALGFPASAQYVALGHLHRRQQVAGPCPIHYCGSPLQLDFGETADDKAVLLVEAQPGAPVTVTEHRLTSGRRLRNLTGTLAELAAAAGTTGADHLRITVREQPRVGLADEVRALFPHCVDVRIERPDGSEPATPSSPARAGRGPNDLFGSYLAEQGTPDPAVLELFGELLEEVG